MDDQTPGPVSAGNGAVSERLQALLARAAHDQLAEQRAVTTALADLREQVVAIAALVRDGELASERRILAHVDEALLGLTEAVLGGRPTPRPPESLTEGEQGGWTAAESPLVEVQGGDALDDAIAAGAAERDPEVFENDADAEVSTDAPAELDDNPAPDSPAPDSPVLDHPVIDRSAPTDRAPDDPGPEDDTVRSAGPAARRIRGALPPMPPVRSARTGDPAGGDRDEDDDGHEDEPRRPWWRPGG